MRVLEPLASLVAGGIFSANTERFLNLANDHLPFPQGLEAINHHILATDNSTTRPLVIWHGLGDSYNSDAMQRVFDILRKVKPELYIYSVHLDEDRDKDQQKSLLADMNEELDRVCEQVMADEVIASALNSTSGYCGKEDPEQGSELQSDAVPGVNAIGFSQGGLFVRGLIERCPGFKVNNLLTFGLPHNGISDLPQCGARDWVCRQRNRFVKARLWDESIQKSVVFAQYFRDVNQFDMYAEHSRLLALLNNEQLGQETNLTYRKRLSALGGRFVMVRFEDDTVVVPRDTAWFADTDAASGRPVLLRDSAQYTQDLVGLRALDVKGRLVFESEPGEHMRISEDTLVRMAEQYL